MFVHINYSGEGLQKTFVYADIASLEGKKYILATNKGTSSAK